MNVYNNLPFSSSVQQFNGSYFQKFHNLKCNVAVPKLNDKYVSNSNGYKTADSKHSLHYNTSNIPEASQTVCMQTQSKSSVVRKLSLKSSVNKIFNDKINDNQESFEPSLTQSHQSANLQYICEQYPLPEFFFSQKSNLNSLTSHSKKFLKNYQCTEAYAKPLNNIGSNRSAANSSQIHSSRIPDAVCCMYPKCHNSYENCKMHLPPERDVAISQPIPKHSINDIYRNYNQNVNEKCKTHLVTSSKLPHNQLSKILNSPLNKHPFKIKEHGFKNSDLKIFKPIDLLTDSKPASPQPHDLKQLKTDDSFYQEQIPLLSKYNKRSYSFMHENKDKHNLSSSVNDISAQKLSNELFLDACERPPLQINNLVEGNLNVHGQNIIEKDIFFETLKQHLHYPDVRNQQSCLLKENEQTMVCIFLRI